MRVAHIADSHFDERNRLDDNVAVHRAFLAQARDENVDLILHAGDFFERRSTPAERNALAEFLVEAAGIAPVVGVKGNHDVDGDLDLFSKLDTRHGIELFDRPGVSEAQSGVIALPWFDKSHVVAASEAGDSRETTTERTIQAARSMLAGLRTQAAGLQVPILVAHVQVAGSETSTGQTLIGQTVELAPSDLADLGCAYVALGHIHKRQDWHDGRVAYSGSPQRMNFGEPEAKGWNLVEIDSERWREPGGVVVRFMELPARRIVLIERDWTAGVTGVPADGIEAGALVRIRYRIRPEDLHLVDEARLAADAAALGAHSVKLEAVLVHEDRVRCAEIVSAATTREKLAAYWIAKGIDVPDASRARVFDKLDEIESRQRAEVAA